jgi:hypothetical protein
MSAEMDQDTQEQIDNILIKVNLIDKHIANVNQIIDDTGKLVTQHVQTKMDDVDRRLDLIDKRFDDYNKRLEDSAKRFDDVKWYVTGISSIFTVILGIIVLVSGWNYSTERASLRDFENEIKERYGHLGESKIELYGINGVDLSGQQIPVRVFEWQETQQNIWTGATKYWGMTFNIVVKNVSNVESGYIYYKVLVNDPLQTDFPSADESKYKYEYQIQPSTTYFNLLPGKYEQTTILTIYLSNQQMPKPDKYPALVKVYYGRGQVTSASVFFVVNQDAPHAPPPPPVPPSSR